MHAAVGLSCSSVCFFVLHSCRPLSARLASHFLRAGSAGFALENRIHWLCGDAYTNREPVDLEKTAELKNQLLLLFWRYWILTRIKERSWATSHHTICSAPSV